MRQPHGQPVLVGTKDSNRLDPVGLSGTGAFDEAWLQRLIHNHPECLPVEEIEPAFDELVPVCMELPTKHGPIDNLLMTPEGDLVLVEVKLWRNPEARRKVVAQALDYASCLFEMDYAELEQAALKGGFVGKDRPKRLYDVFAEHNPKEEAAFVDAVNANLKRGRALILVAGDGIRTEAVRLASLVQGHAGAHFTFALVELGVYRMPDGEGFLVLPRTLAQTEMISRAIVRIDDRRTFVVPDGRQPETPATAAPKPMAESMSADQFFEVLAKLNPSLPDKLRAFIARVEPLGVYSEFRKSLIFKWDPPEGKTISLGYIDRWGALWTQDVNLNAHHDLSHQYLEELAAAIGAEVRRPADGKKWDVMVGGHAPKITAFVDKLDRWAETMEYYLDRLKARIADQAR